MMKKNLLHLPPSSGFGAKSRFQSLLIKGLRFSVPKPWRKFEEQRAIKTVIKINKKSCLPNQIIEYRMPQAPSSKNFFQEFFVKLFKEISPFRILRITI